MPAYTGYTKLCDAVRSVAEDHPTLVVMVVDHHNVERTSFTGVDATDEAVVLAENLAYTALQARRPTADYVTYQMTWHGEEAWRNYAECTPLVAYPTREQRVDARFILQPGGIPIHAHHDDVIIGALAVVMEGEGQQDILEAVAHPTWRVQFCRTRLHPPVSM